MVMGTVWKRMICQVSRLLIHRSVDSPEFCHDLGVSEAFQSGGWISLGHKQSRGRVTGSGVESVWDWVLSEG